MILSISCVLVVIFSLPNSLFKHSHTFSIGFMSGEFPGHRNTGILCSSRYFVIDFALWHGAPSCINTLGPFPNHSVSCGMSFASRTLRYWSCRIVPSTTYSLPMPLLLMQDQIMTEVGCLTVFLTQSWWYFSSGLLLTYWERSDKIWTDDSSLKHTCDKKKNGHD